MMWKRDKSIFPEDNKNKFIYGNMIYVIDDDYK